MNAIHDFIEKAEKKAMDFLTRTIIGQLNKSR